MKQAGKLIIDQRVKDLVEAGYNPHNHPDWVTVQELQQNKAELHKKHQEFLEQYKKK